MNFIIPLILVTILSLFFTTSLKKHTSIYYAIASLIAILTTIYEISRLTSDFKLTGFLGTLEQTSMKGFISIAFFILVMYAGALDNKLSITKKLLTIRAELAILGSIMILPHAVMYIVRMIVLKIPKFISTGNVQVLYLVYAFIGIIAFIIMLPLFVTSIKGVRKKMQAKRWKQIQRWAYLFYFLAYIHIILSLLNGKVVNWNKIIYYNIIFGGYMILRVLKYRHKVSLKNANLFRTVN